MGLRALNNPASDFEDVFASTGSEAGPPWVYPGAGTWIGDRAIAAGGNISAGQNDTIDYYDISSISNAGDFGVLTTPRHAAWGCSNST